MAIIQSEGQLEWVERNRYLFINRKYLNDSLMSAVGEVEGGQWRGGSAGDCFELISAIISE